MNISLRRHLVVNIKYAYQRANTAYYQRKIPLDLLDRYPGKTHIKINLHTLDPRVIATKVERLNKEHVSVPVEF